MGAAWLHITYLGDSALTLPIGGMFGIWTAMQRWWRGTVGWCIALMTSGALLLASKLILHACGPTFFHLNGLLISPSGHAATSATVYGGLALALTRGKRSGYQVGILMLVAIAIGLIALSRVMLGTHTPAEVAAGLAIGALALLLFYRVGLRSVPPRLSIRILVLLCAVVIATQYGSTLPIERAITRLALCLRHAVPACG
jgi:membrane-associated phospholipid phosphatase